MSGLRVSTKYGSLAHLSRAGRRGPVRDHRGEIVAKPAAGYTPYAEVPNTDPTRMRQDGDCKGHTCRAGDRQCPPAQLTPGFLAGTRR